MSLFTQAPESLCIVRLSAIGDCVHTVAVVQAIQRQWPQTRITWIMGKVEAMLLAIYPVSKSYPSTRSKAGVAIGRFGDNSRGADSMPCCICSRHCAPAC